MISDEPFFLDSRGQRLFAIWQGAESPKAAVLYCHPFGEEKKSAHRAFVETARALAAQGIASLRFDMTGCGDSDGEFKDATVARWVEDIEAAWAEMGRHAHAAPKVLLGLRLGASLAAMVVERLRDVRALVLWQPIIQGKAEFDTDLRRLAIQQMMVKGRAAGAQDFRAAMERGELDLDGYPLSPALYDGICTMDLGRLRAKFPADTALVQFGRPVSRIQAFADVEPRLPTALVELPPFWSRTEFLPGPTAGRLLAQEAICNCLSFLSPKPRVLR